MKLIRDTKANPSPDLLVCFPSRSHFALMPNPLCSPARASDSNKLRRYHRRRRSAESPVVWAKAKTMGGSEVSEPSSPKVTCAGQIKMRPKSRKSWESVMEEIERIHNRRELRRRRFNWVESLGFKKDIMQFLTCLRSIRFDFGCFGAFPEAEFTSEDEEEEDVAVQGSDGSRTAFSKWFMVLQGSGVRRDGNGLCTVDDASIGPPMAPPRNALLLMRCRSAPAKSWAEEGCSEEEEATEVKVKKSLKWLMEEENRESRGLVTRSQSWKV